MYENEELNTQVNTDTEHPTTIVSDTINESTKNVVPIPAQVPYLPKRRRLTKAALSVYILIVAVLYAIVVFLSVAVSNRPPEIEEHQIENNYLQTYEA